jgi:glycine cleavage system regulatory protein
MQASLVLTIIGADRTGLVQSIAKTVAAYEGNWVESRMARLAGHFAGILCVTVAQERAAALQDALLRLKTQGLDVMVEVGHIQPPPADTRLLELEVIGQDRPGIVREIAQALAQRGVNVEELATECYSAPMSGETLFKATAELRAPASLPLEQLRSALEQIANEMMVEINLHDAPV